MSGCADCIHEKVCGMADQVKEERVPCPDMLPYCRACKYAHSPQIMDGEVWHHCVVYGFITRGNSFCEYGEAR